MQDEETHRSSMWAEPTVSTDNKHSSKVWYKSISDCQQEAVERAMDAAAFKPIKRGNSHCEKHFNQLAETSSFELRVDAHSAFFLVQEQNVAHAVLKRYNFGQKADFAAYTYWKSGILNGKLKLNVPAFTAEERIFFPRSQQHHTVQPETVTADVSVTVEQPIQPIRRNKKSQSLEQRGNELVSEDMLAAYRTQ